ncbi:VOC family protein [Nocardioides sp. LMS-CY]|uniref:VOC family protein n=1 Tax=Nocardioides sp. (strain LMS-CY) TaxID=2840457 RepID=UPI001C008EAB|nr:VOC family protein [Nocardioides sp. LMS-CY]QWF21365.1 VOC family protein [Nocardioides sp. LMS-CY]
MAIARFPTFVYDCPDAGRLARFYATLLGWDVQEDPGGWIDIRPADGGSCISFQQVEGYRAPEWPGQERPQQLHLDVVVPDLDAAEAEVLELGATRAAHQPGTTFRVFLDPAGHPFCLCTQ